MLLSCDVALLRRTIFAGMTAILLLAAAVPACVYAVDPLAERSANLRIKRDQVEFLYRMGQVDGGERHKRLIALRAEEHQIGTDLKRRPREQHATMVQEAERLYQIRIAPLRADWDRKLEEHRNALAARDRVRDKELPVDVEHAARIQVAQGMAREKLQRGEISQAQFAREAREAEQTILAIQRKYDGYGTSWGNRFAHGLSVRTTHLLKAAPATQPPLARAPIPPGGAPASSLPQAQSGASARPPAPPAPPQTGGNVPSTAGRETAGKARPPAPPPPPQPRAEDSAWLTWAFWLVALATGGGYYAHRRRRRSSAPKYSQAANEYAPPPAIPDEQAAPASESSAAAQPAAPATAASGASLKERLFAEQRAKYQGRYNDLMDEMTSASAQLTRMAPVVTTLQANLTQLSRAVQSRFEALVRKTYGSYGKLLLSAALLKPLFRFFMRFGILGKIIFAVVAYSLISRAISATYPEDLPVMLVFVYVLVVAVFFFISRRLQLKAPLALLKSNAQHFKSMRLAYVYEGQAPHASNGRPAYAAVSIGPATSQRTAIEDITLPAAKDSMIEPGTFLLGIGELAAYRIDRNGAVARVSPSNTDLMSDYGELLTAALGEQQAFATASLEPLARYGQIAWRRRKASAEAPRLEKVVKNVDRLEQLWLDTYVSDKVFPFLLRRIDLFNVRDPATPSGILLYGYSGNGKAHLAQQIAASVSARFEPVSPTALASAEEIKALWEKSRGNQPVVLFVDSAERVFPRPGSDNQGAGTREGTLAWITEWGKYKASDSRVWVVMSAQSEEGLHPAVLTEISGSKIEVSAPDAAGRELILRAACRENELPSLPGWLTADTAGASIRELRRIVEETKLLSIPNAPQDAHWQEALKTVRGADGLYRDPLNTWDRLVLPREIKEQLQSACKAIQNPERYKKKGAGIPNLLLFGPPGTGKTQIARTLANESGVRFFEASLADIKSKWTGESAHLVRDIFAKAREKAPAVLFLDEIDAVAAKRNAEGSDGFTKDVVTQVLREMEGVQKHDRPIFVLGATNLQYVSILCAAGAKKFQTSSSAVPAFTR